MLVDLSLLKTAGDIDTAVPQTGEEMGVDLDVSEPVTLVEERVANVGGSVCLTEGIGVRPIIRRDAVIVRRSPNRNAVLEVRRGRIGVVVDWSGSGNRSILADKRIEDAGWPNRKRGNRIAKPNRGNQGPQIGASCVAAINTLDVQALVDISRVISPTADEAVVLNGEVSINSGDVTIVVLVEECAAVGQLVLETIRHRTQVVTKGVEGRRSRFSPAVGIGAHRKGRAGQAVVLLDLGIHDISVELEAITEDFVAASHEIHRFLHCRNGWGEGAEVES